MNPYTLHPANDVQTVTHPCTPCEPAHSAAAAYWPAVLMQRCQLANTQDEFLRVEIRNPWPNLVLRHVKIAFLTTMPNPFVSHGRHAVTFNPAHGIEFGDIVYTNPHEADSMGAIRDIILLETQPLEEGRQFYAGICFDACTARTDRLEHYGYVLFKSGLLKQPFVLEADALHRAA